MSFVSAFVAASGLAVATLVACAGTTATPSPSPSDPTTTAPAFQSLSPTSAANNHKPTAPLELALAATPVANTVGRYTVTLTTTAQADLDDVVVTIDGQPHKLGTLRNRAVATVSSTVELGGKPGRDIIGAAQLIVQGRAMSKAAALRLGAPAAPPPPAATVTLPDGTVVNEAR